MSVSSKPGLRRTVDETALGVTSVFQKTHEHAVVDHDLDADEKVLVALGYRQEFKRDFSIWSCFSVSFSLLGILPSVASTLTYNLAYSGPAGSVWGWIVASFLIQFVGLSMAELCSSMPTAGGLYYASAVLAPEGWGPLAAWVGKIARSRPTTHMVDLTSTADLGDGMVELPRPADGTYERRICLSLYDPYRGHDRQSRVHHRDVAHLPDTSVHPGHLRTHHDAEHQDHRLGQHRRDLGEPHSRCGIRHLAAGRINQPAQNQSE